MSIIPVPDHGLLAEIEALIEKTTAEIKKCEEARTSGHQPQQDALTKCDEAYKKACYAITNFAGVLKGKEEQFTAAKNNFFHSGQYVVASFASLKRMERCINVIVNFMLHHGHGVSGGSSGKTFICSPAYSDPDFESTFFSGELKEHTERVGGMRYYDQEKMARMLGRK